jgi:hypothetical protein
VLLSLLAYLGVTGLLTGALALLRPRPFLIRDWRVGAGLVAFGLLPASAGAWWPVRLRASAAGPQGGGRIGLGRSASHVQDGIRVGRLPLQEFDGACCRHNDQLDLAALGFTLHLVHHRESTGARTDD